MDALGPARAGSCAIRIGQLEAKRCTWEILHFYGRVERDGAVCWADAVPMTQLVRKSQVVLKNNVVFLVDAYI